jgi:hypothetical protein
VVRDPFRDKVPATTGAGNSTAVESGHAAWLGERSLEMTGAG